MIATGAGASSSDQGASHFSSGSGTNAGVGVEGFGGGGIAFSVEAGENTSGGGASMMAGWPHWVQNRFPVITGKPHLVHDSATTDDGSGSKRAAEIGSGEGGGISTPSSKMAAAGSGGGAVFETTGWPHWVQNFFPAITAEPHLVQNLPAIVAPFGCS